MWQVAGGYVVVAWAVGAVVDQVVSFSGLPGWTATLALLLLILLFPLVVATTLVQGGLPGLRIEDVNPAELEALTPAQVLVIPQAHPLYDSRLFTWRSTVLGGLSAGVLLVASVVAYMAMWALGIGPVGSLLAQGVIQPSDPVVLTSVENRTADPSLGRLVTETFVLELERSSIVTLSRVASAPRLLVGGTVSRSGEGYRLTSSLSLPAGGTVARFEEISDGDDDLLLTVERLAERVRERLGESLRVIREGERLAPIVTDSARAVILYRDADRASLAGDVGGAIELLQQSVEVDPSFVLAWSRLGVLSEQAADFQMARDAYGRVLDLWGAAGAAERTVDRIRDQVVALDGSAPGA